MPAYDITASWLVRANTVAVVEDGGVRVMELSPVELEVTQVRGESFIKRLMQV